MARSGILYSHVMKAAALVAADGRNPTVDNVREALGGTGSKSTIAPLLKRWKEEHQLAPEQTELGLPVELVGAMQSLVEKLRLDLSRQLEQAREEQRIALAAAQAQVKAALADTEALARLKAALSLELGSTQAALAQLKEEHQHRAVTLATVHSDNLGLNQRLADRAAEVAALNGQLTQVRAQFEHYQQAAATQRTEERQAFEQRLNRLEQDNAMLQQRAASQQTVLAQQEMRIGQASADNTRLQQALDGAEQELALLRPERDQLNFYFKEAAANAQTLSGELDESQQALLDARMACAGHQKQVEMLAASVAAATRREERWSDERLLLLRENAMLQAQAKVQADADRKSD